MYCGTDIIEVNRIKQAIEDNINFKEKIFTKKEIEDIDKSIDIVKYQRYAGRFAGKESVYKALSKLLIDNNLNVEFKDIEIVNLNDLKRRPKVNIINSKVNESLKDYNIDISISHVKESAIAMCIVSKIN